MRFPVVLYLCCCGLLALRSTPLAAQPQPDTPSSLLYEAWQAIDSTYYEPTFHGVEWAGAYQALAQKTYHTPTEAYTAIGTLLARLNNPATRHLTPAQAAALLPELSGEAHDGVGLIELLSIDTDAQTGAISVVTPVFGGPAAQAGIKPGDVIRRINHQSVQGLSLAEVAMQLRGPAGSRVSVTVARGNDTLVFPLTRARIEEQPAVTGHLQTVQGHRIAYLGLRQFTAGASEQLEALLTDYEAQGVAGYLLDLRNNPGGFLTAAVDIAGLFLGAKPVAYLHGRTAPPSVMQANTSARTNKPLVVLINRGSASAAELLAGAIQAHQRGRLFGETTFGKGLVHGWVPLSDGSVVMPTIGRLETAHHRDILDEAVIPDLLLEAPSPLLDPAIGIASAEDIQFQTALAALLKQL